MIFNISISISSVGPMHILGTFKQTRYVEPTPTQGWSTVNNGSPTLKQH